MNYAVIMRKTAEEELAAVWNDAADRNAVTYAMDEIERRLRRDPLGLGESGQETTDSSSSARLRFSTAWIRRAGRCTYSPLGRRRIRHNGSVGGALTLPAGTHIIALATASP